MWGVCIRQKAMWGNHQSKECGAYVSDNAIWGSYQTKEYKVCIRRNNVRLSDEGMGGVCIRLSNVR